MLLVSYCLSCTSITLLLALILPGCASAFAQLAGLVNIDLSTDGDFAVITASIGKNEFIFSIHVSLK